MEDDERPTGILDAARDLGSRISQPTWQQGLLRQAEALRQPLSAIRSMPRLPSDEAIATGAVRDEVERLSEITAALLELGVEQRASQDRATRTSERAANVIIALTAVLVVLTYLLAAEALQWWPFV